MEERELIRAVLAAFRGSTGLPASVARHLGRAAEIDAIVTVAGRALAVEVKRNVDRLEVVPTAKTQLDRARVHYRLEGGLLVTEYLSLNILDACRLHGLYAADLSGNAFVEWDGLLVFVAGRPRHRVQRDRKSVV